VGGGGSGGGGGRGQTSGRYGQLLTVGVIKGAAREDVVMNSDVTMMRETTILMTEVDGKVEIHCAYRTTEIFKDLNVCCSNNLNPTNL